MTDHSNNRVAIVTGGNSVIGKATALLFGKQGISVVIAARNKKRAESVITDIAAAGGMLVLLKQMCQNRIRSYV